MDFRKAVESDIDEISSMIEDVKAEFKSKGITMWQNGYPNRDSVVSDVASNEAYVVEIDGKTAGYMFICYSEEPFHSTLRGKWMDSNPSVMHRLITKPEFRGNGLGTSMMEFWGQKAREHGCSSLRTETDLTNIPMRTMMRKLGFSEPGLLTFDNSDKVGLEKVLYSLAIHSSSN